MEPFKTMAVIHSLCGNNDEITIIEKISSEPTYYIACYKGTKCKAIFNPFNGKYYVDDLYGVINETEI